METTVKTNKKYDYRLTINSIKDNEGYQKMKHVKGKNFQVHGRYVRENGESVYNVTVRYFKNKAAAIHFYYKKMNSVKA